MPDKQLENQVWIRKLIKMTPERLQWWRRDDVSYHIYSSPVCNNNYNTHLDSHLIISFHLLTVAKLGELCAYVAEIFPLVCCVFAAVISITLYSTQWPKPVSIQFKLINCKKQHQECIKTRLFELKNRKNSGEPQSPFPRTVPQWVWGHSDTPHTPHPLIGVLILAPRALDSSQIFDLTSGASICPQPATPVSALGLRSKMTLKARPRFSLMKATVFYGNLQSQCHWNLKYIPTVRHTSTPLFYRVLV